MTYIYTIRVLLSMIQKLVKISPALEEIFHQVNEQIHMVVCRIEDLEHVKEQLEEKISTFRSRGRVECDGDYVFHMGSSGCQKIRAIKGIRAIFDLGLREAKDMVEGGRCPKPVGGMKVAVEAVLEECGYVIQNKDKPWC